MKFEGTSSYIATEDLKVAVNAAITLERPIIVKGEPGTGKTMLAHEVAKSLDAEIITWHIKSTTKAQQGLYEYDAVTRLRDSQLGDEKVKDIKNYISKGKLWNAFESDKRPVLLIDWLKLLMTDDVDAKILREKDPKKLIPPLHGALLKNEQDVHLFERLAFISRRENENVE